MQFNRGYLSPYFVTDPRRMEDRARGRLHAALREEGGGHERPPPASGGDGQGPESRYLIISEDVEGDALAAWWSTNLRGNLKCAAVKAPGYGDRRKDMLGDIAVVVGGSVIAEELGSLA